ncbi:class II aldolase/adducin family protein [Thermodesulfovibrio hydrogeniphilus]
MELKNEREKIVRIAKKIYQMGLVTEISGNLSLRVSENQFLITPSGKSYEKLKASEIVLLDMNGNIIEGIKKPSTETKLHIEIYKARQDVNAIIHTHSTYACVLASLEMLLPAILDEQKEVFGGEVKVSKYAPAGSEALALEAVKALGNGKAAILSKHGTVSVGKDLREAYIVCELLERLSKIYIFTTLMKKSLGGKAVSEIASASKIYHSLSTNHQ